MFLRVQLGDFWSLFGHFLVTFWSLFGVKFDPFLATFWSLFYTNFGPFLSLFDNPWGFCLWQKLSETNSLWICRSRGLARQTLPFILPRGVLGCFPKFSHFLSSLKNLSHKFSHFLSLLKNLSHKFVTQEVPKNPKSPQNHPKSPQNGPFWGDLGVQKGSFCALRACQGHPSLTPTPIHYTVVTLFGGFWSSLFCLFFVSLLSHFCLSLLSLLKNLSHKFVTQRTPKTPKITPKSPKMTPQGPIWA